MRVGQDPDEVDRLGADLGAAAGTLQSLRQEVSGLMGGTTWSGPDRDRFESEWSGPTASLISRASEALEEASRAASASAQRQRVASGTA